MRRLEEAAHDTIVKHVEKVLGIVQDLTAKLESSTIELLGF
jgi:hypothetical protein